MESTGISKASVSVHVIEGEFPDRPIARDWLLEITTGEPEGLAAADVQRAVKSCYERMEASSSRELRMCPWVGQWSLPIGAAVFIACLLTAQVSGARVRVKAPPARDGIGGADDHA